MVKRFFRDNKVINYIGRNFLKFLSTYFFLPVSVLNRYRVYGDVQLRVLSTSFLMNSKADDFIANDLYYNIKYEEAEFLLIQKISKHCKVFVDVGANTGVFSLFVSSLNNNIDIIAFEPHPENYKRLVFNNQLNSFCIKCINSAVGDECGEVEFTIPADGSLSTISSNVHSFSSTFHPIATKKISVEQITLDSINDGLELGKYDIIKIDVEFYELAVLQGAMHLLSKVKPLIIMEVLIPEAIERQFPLMKGKLPPHHASRIENLMFELGYFSYEIRKDGVLRVDTIVDGSTGRNFLFAPVKTQQNFVAYRSIDLLYNLL